MIDLSRYAQIIESDAAHVRQASLRVDGACCRRRHNRQVFEAVVGRQSDPVPVAETQDATVFVPACQQEARRQDD